MTTRGRLQLLMTIGVACLVVACESGASEEKKAPPELQEITLPGMGGTNDGSGSESTGGPGAPPGAGANGASGYVSLTHCREQDNTMAAGTPYEFADRYIT